MLLILAFYARFWAQCLRDYHGVVSNSVVASLYIYNIIKNCQIVTLISKKTQKNPKMLNTGPLCSIPGPTGPGSRHFLLFLSPPTDSLGKNT